MKIDQDFGVAYSGVLADRAGRVRALWGSYSEQVDKEEREWTAGLPAAIFYPWVNRLVADLEAPSPFTCPPSVRVLNAELEPLLLSKAAQFGLPAEWVSRLVELDPERRQVLRVRATVAGSHAQRVLKDADMVLAVEDRPVSSFADVERIIAAAGSGGGANKLKAVNGTSHVNGEHGSTSPGAGSKRHSSDDEVGDEVGAQGDAPDRKRPRGVAGAIATAEVPSPHDGHASSLQESNPLPEPSVTLTVFRGGEIHRVEVRLGEEDGLGTDRLVHWCGAQLQAPHRGVRELGYVPEGCSGVYISRWHHGSPSHRYGLYALHWILDVNGTPTPDLDAFLAVVGRLGDGADVRLRVVHYETNRIKVLTLKTDLRYWPTWELRLDKATGEWERAVTEGGVAGHACIELSA